MDDRLATIAGHLVTFRRLRHRNAGYHQRNGGKRQCGYPDELFHVVETKQRPNSSTHAFTKPRIRPAKPMLSPIPMIGYHSLVASISRADLMARQKMTLDAALAQVVHLNETGQLQQSLHLARQVAQAAPGSAVAQNVLSAAAEATGDLAEAEKAARAAIRIDPQMVDAHYNLGNALRRLGRYKEAIDALQRARSLAPQDLHVLFNLSLSFQEISQFERAIEGFRQVLAIDPEHDSAALGLVLCLTSEDEQEEAEELARHLINRTPKDERV